MLKRFDSNRKNTNLFPKPDIEIISNYLHQSNVPCKIENYHFKQYNVLSKNNLMLPCKIQNFISSNMIFV